MEYNFKEIEKKWQKYWEENESFKALDNSNLDKFYALVEFPYPSGVGMHIGHIKAYMGLETLVRKRRREGQNVLFPIGFDAFGLPAENYAIKTGRHPREVTMENINNFVSQMKNVGFSFDWDRTVDTTDPNYYKWTQWIFLKLFENGLAYRDKTYVNFCPKCKVVLSNEDSQGGKCDRCDSQVIQKEKDVWFLKITNYAEKLLEGLDELETSPRIKQEQINWIGKSNGAYVNFEILGHDEQLKVFTTRPDTLFGATFMVIAPEHPLIDKLSDEINNMDAIIDYQKKTSEKSEFERVQLAKDKTGVEIEGIKAINPVSGEEIEIWVSDYVMMNYGTGAIMAVPAHDERDFEFATKYNIPIQRVIAEHILDKDNLPREGAPNTIRKVTMIVLKHWEEEKYALQVYKNGLWECLLCGGIEEGETSEETAIREVFEETGYKNVKRVTVLDMAHVDEFYQANKKVNRVTSPTDVLVELEDGERISISEEEANIADIEWCTKEEMFKRINITSHIKVFETAVLGAKAYIGDGIMINSDFLNGIDNKEKAIDKMIEYLEENKIGERTIQYKMQDWAFNRQRYWGEPIPIVHCPECGMVPVPEKDLPLRLPEVKDYQPNEGGESPLANIEEWVNTPCPICGKIAKRETDTMPQWAGSSWYFLRYIDPHNENKLADMDKLKKWLKVDWYNGGMEHVTRHVIYSRFWHRFLYDIGVVPTKEPYAKRTNQGLVLGPDGEKMSKSKGNVVDPTDIINEYGADTLRTYILFIGEYDKEGVWNDNGVKGVKRFLNRVWGLLDRLDGDGISKDLESIVNQTIKKVSLDIEDMKYNTAIASLMTLVNAYYKKDTITKDELNILIRLLNPYAPHITEEINEVLENENKLVDVSWPTYDKSKIIEETYEMIVQVNGKVRAKLNMPMNSSKEEMEEKALTEENVIKFTSGKEIIKKIVVPNKLVNIVIK